MDSENHLIDINLADEESLTHLRGVGSRLARRIIAARPFESIEELQRVRGISGKDVERLRPSLSISQETADTDDAEIEEISALSDESEVDLSEEITTTAESDQLVEALDTDEDVPEEGLEDAILVAIPEIEAEPEDLQPPVPKEEEKTELEVVTFEPIPESEAVETEEASIPVEPEPVSDAEMKQTETSPGYITRGRAIALVFFSCFLTVVLAVTITLGIISSLNRGHLTFAAPSQITTLQTEVNGLSIQTETLTSDLEGLRTRLDNLEALSGRVNDLENEITMLSTELDGLQTKIDTTQAQYQEVESQLETVNAQIETLETQTSFFENFLQGLRNLLSDLPSDTQE